MTPGHLKGPPQDVHKEKQHDNGQHKENNTFTYVLENAIKEGKISKVASAPRKRLQKGAE